MATQGIISIVKNNVTFIKDYIMQKSNKDSEFGKIKIQDIFGKNEDETMEIELGKIIIKGVSDDKKDEEYYFVKKLIIESKTYPEIEIKQLDLCPNGTETFDIQINICAHMTKNELFEFLKIANERTNATLFYKDDQLPGKVTIETFPSLKDLKEE